MQHYKIFEGTNFYDVKGQATAFIEITHSAIISLRHFILEEAGQLCSIGLLIYEDGK